MWPADDKGSCLSVPFKAQSPYRSLLISTDRSATTFRVGSYAGICSAVVCVLPHVQLTGVVPGAGYVQAQGVSSSSHQEWNLPACLVMLLRVPGSIGRSARLP